MPTKTKKAQDVLTLDDQAKIAELTGGSAESISEALSQWEAEQNALRDFGDENQALLILHKRINEVNQLGWKFIEEIEKQSALFLTPKMRATLAAYRQAYEEEAAAFKASKEYIKDHQKK
jgi:hypothetical protein